MTLTRFEAILNGLFLLGFALMVFNFSPITTSEAYNSLEGMPITMQDSRNASYEVDEYETCLIIEQKPESICARLEVK